MMVSTPVMLVATTLRVLEVVFGVDVLLVRVQEHCAHLPLMLVAKNRCVPLIERAVSADDLLNLDEKHHLTSSSTREQQTKLDSETHSNCVSLDLTLDFSIANYRTIDPPQVLAVVRL